MSGQMGSDVRALRKARGITLVALSSAVGRSVGWLSQVERGLSTPSLISLYNLAATLDTNVETFLQQAPQQPAVFTLAAYRFNWGQVTKFDVAQPHHC